MATLTQTNIEKAKLKESISVTWRALTETKTEKIKLKEGQDRYLVLWTPPPTVPRVVQAATIARGTQSTANGPTNTGIYSPIDNTRVPATVYPTTVPKEELTYNGPSRTLKVVHAEANKVSVVTLTSPGNGINSSSTTKYTNPIL